MYIDIVTLFPGMFQGPFDDSIIKKAKERGIVNIRFHDIRDFSLGKNRQVDDYLYGGGAGMILKVEPVDRLLQKLIAESDKSFRLLLMSPQGSPLLQKSINKFAYEEHLVILCGHYKGLDERIRIKYHPEEVSIGDYVLSGGEIAAMVLVDAVVRLLPGAVEHEDSVMTDSFQKPRLDCPHYTRPREYEGMLVPEVLLSGNHAHIDNWRLCKSVERTQMVRPDILQQYPMDSAEKKAFDLKKKK